MRVQGLGRELATVCGAAGLGCFAVMAQHCVRVVELSAAAMQRCVQRLRIVQGGLCTIVCTCAHRVHSAGQVRRHRRRDRRALLSMWRTRTSEGTGGPEHKIEDRQLCGEWRSRGKQRVITASTLHLLLGHCNCLLLGCLWAQHLCYL